MAGRLVDLDKSPGVRPVGIGVFIRLLMAKLVQSITTHQAMEACGSNNLCDGLKSVIQGAVHASEKEFGRKTPPNVVSSDIHPEGANILETLWEEGSEYTDPPDIEDVDENRHSGKGKGRPMADC